MFVFSGCLISINAAMLKGVPNNGDNSEYEVLLSSSHSSLYAYRGMGTGISAFISVLSSSAFASQLPVNFCGV